MNTNDFCLTFLYCSVENSNINKTGEINLPTLLSMLFLSDSFPGRFVLCMTLSKLLPGRSLHECHTRGQVNSLSGAFMCVSVG